MSEKWLTAADPEPPRGTTVEGDVAGRWTRTIEPDTDYWLPADDDGSRDPESWNKIAGNYGPVQVVRAVCRTCRVTYDATDPAVIKLHTEPVNDCHCGRCRGKPGCYPCGSSFCMCPSH